MAAVIHAFVDNYNRIWDLRDPRVENWLFMGSPLSTLSICLTYVMIVKVWGPNFMKNRPPYEFRRLLIFYNFVQVIFSTWLFYECLMGGWLFHYSFKCQPVDYSDDPIAIRFGRGGWFHGYSFKCQPVDYSLDDVAVRIAMSGWLNGYSYRCQPVDYSDNPLAIRMVYACWWYYFSKFTEFFDTFFFVLRKKDEHVSLLHVVHHGIMPMSVWFGVRFTPGGHSTFFGLLNTFVHIVMYFYYMVAAMGPKYQKFIWWKKYLTTFQMVQFVAIVVHAFQLLFVDCNYPKAFVWWIGCHGVLFFCLFSDFYKRSYKQKKALAASRAKGKANGYSNGYTNGYSNGTHTNGNANGTHSNGHVNGHANGHTNGHANGKAHQENGHTNGHANGHANGHSNGYTNGAVHSKSE